MINAMLMFLVALYIFMLARIIRDYYEQKSRIDNLERRVNRIPVPMEVIITKGGGGGGTSEMD